MREMICISCPRGCHLTVDETAPYSVQGNLCPRGEEYGRNEVMNPMRVVTSTVWVNNVGRTCPVKTDHPIPKSEIFHAMESLKHVKVMSPIKRGQEILPNVCGSNARFIATKDV